MNRSETISKLASALISFNSEVSKIAKDAANPFHKNKYATLDQIIDEVRPILNKNKLAIMQNVSGEEGTMTVKTLLLHESGEWMESTGTTLKLAKNDPQGAGAGITYARRYDLCAFLSLNTGDDDDGNSASGLDGKRKNANTDLITQQQVGELKTKLYELASLRKESPRQAYDDLGIKGDITQLNKKQADAAIKKVDVLIKEAKEKMGA